MNYMMNFAHNQEVENLNIFKSWRPENRIYCYGGGSGSSSGSSTYQNQSAAASGPTLNPQQILSMYGTALPSMASTATNAAQTTASPALNASNNLATQLGGAINLNGLSPGESNSVERANNQTLTSTGNLGLTNPTNTIANALNFGGAFNQKVGLATSALGATTGAANAGTNNLSATSNLFSPITSTGTAPTFGSVSSGSGSGNSSSSNFNVGCFLTTACCEHKGLPDDCEELTILRNFRDTFVPKEMIEEYYNIAPNICVKLQGDRETLDKVYDTIKACVTDIKSNRNWSALIRYRNMVKYLKEGL